MTLNFTDPAVLTTTVNSLGRIKYIPLEIHAISLMSNTKYQVYYNGNLVNAFCKPFGGDLGADMVSDPYGKLTFLFLMAIPYNQTYLVNNNPSASAAGTQLASASATIELVAPNGTKSINYIPIQLKM